MPDNSTLYGILFNGTGTGMYGDPEQFWAVPAQSTVYNLIGPAAALAATPSGQGVLVGTPVTDPVTGEVTYAAYDGLPVVARDLNSYRGIGHGKMADRKFLRKNGFNAFYTDGAQGAGLYHFDGGMSRHLYKKIMRNQRHAVKDMKTALKMQDPTARPDWWGDAGMSSPYSKYGAEGLYYVHGTKNPYTVTAIGSTKKPGEKTDDSKAKVDDSKAKTEATKKEDAKESTTKTTTPSSGFLYLGQGSARWGGVNRVSTKDFTKGFNELKAAFESDFGTGSFSATFKGVSNWQSLFNYIWRDKNHGGLSKSAALGVRNHAFLRGLNGALGTNFIKYMKTKGQEYLKKSDKITSARYGGRLLWVPFNPSYYV